MAKLGRKSTHNWPVIKAEYVTGTMTRKQLCLTWGIPYPTLQTEARKRKWADARELHQLKVYNDLLDQDQDIKKARLSMLRSKTSDVVGNMVERLQELGEQAKERPGLGKKEQEEYEKLQALVTGNLYMDPKQTKRLFELSEKAGRMFGLEPADCEKVMRAADLALTVGERALGLGAIPEVVQVNLRYTPDRLRNRDQENEE